MTSGLWIAIANAPTFFDNLRNNLFQPLLLFFYMGFLVPILRVKLDFPHVIYQGLTIFLLIAIGWHGGEELANLQRGELWQAMGFMGVGFVTNTCIGLLAYAILRSTTKLKRVDAATVAGYYGSDSAGTFVTCVGILTSLKIAYAAYMPVMLAVMEIPGCLVALFIVSSLRRRGMDGFGNLPGDPGYDASAKPLDLTEEGDAAEETARGGHGHGKKHDGHAGGVNLELLHEVFLNPGIFLLFGGIFIGFVGESQGPAVMAKDDKVFTDLFHGLLCLFLLEMGMTASRKLKDLRAAGLPFILFGLIAPNVFAVIGMLVANVFGHISGHSLDHGTYVLFAVLCAAASYIAVPAVQRLAIPEASPTLPLAASLGLTFSYNVTIGITTYIYIAEFIMKIFPISGAVVKAAAHG